MTREEVGLGVKMAVRAITFDVYSALFDTISGLTQAAAALLRARGDPGDPATVARTWRQKHTEYLLVANSLDREPASNRKALEASASYALRQLNPRLTADEIRTLVGVWERLPPWPETVDVLQVVRRHPVTLGTLSNGDEGMLRTLLVTLPVAFDRVVSTEGGKFKPHPSVYKKALQVMGVRSEELLHVAGSPTDAMGATASGIRTIWVNRGGDVVVEPALAPAYELNDLRGVLEILDHGIKG